MKATGIVRRIDDLGRVVIPKEIRMNMRIREGDPLEIYTADGGVFIKKYTPPPAAMGEEAQDWLVAHRREMSNRGVRFSIRDNITICEGVSPHGQWVHGEARCKPNEDFIPAIGMVYAYCRAFNVRLPDNWT